MHSNSRRSSVVSDSDERARAVDGSVVALSADQLERDRLSSSSTRPLLDAQTALATSVTVDSNAGSVVEESDEDGNSLPVANEDQVRTAIEVFTHSNLDDEAVEKLTKRFFVTERLSVLTKVAYGMAEGGLFTAVSIPSYFLSTFLLEVVGLNPYAEGLVLVLAQFYFAIADPLIGQLSDKTKTRWGRRRPWMLFGALPFVIFFFLMWVVPPVPSAIPRQLGLAVYFLIVEVLFKTGYGCVLVPYTSLTPNLTEDYDERTSLTTFRMVQGVFISTVSVAVMAWLITAFPGPNGRPRVAVGYLVGGFVFAIVIFICVAVTFLFVRERRGINDEEKSHGGLRDFISSIREAIVCRSFVLVTLCFVLVWFSATVLQSNLILYTKYVAFVNTRALVFVFAIQISMLVSLVPWFLLSRTIGKKRTFYCGGGLFLAACVVFLSMPAGYWWLIVFGCILFGFSMGAGLLIPWSMLPDVTDEDELNFGQRREGIFYSLFLFSQKVGIGVSYAFSALVLGLSGYISPDSTSGVVSTVVQPFQVRLALRCLLGVVPAVLVMIAIVCVYFFPITRRVHREYALTLNVIRKARKQAVADRTKAD